MGGFHFSGVTFHYFEDEEIKNYLQCWEWIALRCTDFFPFNSNFFFSVADVHKTSNLICTMSSFILL